MTAEIRDLPQNTRDLATLRRSSSVGQVDVAVSVAVPATAAVVVVAAAAAP